MVMKMMKMMIYVVFGEADILITAPKHDTHLQSTIEAIIDNAATTVISTSSCESEEDFFEESWSTKESYTHVGIAASIDNGGDSADDDRVLQKDPPSEQFETRSGTNEQAVKFNDDNINNDDEFESNDGKR